MVEAGGRLSAPGASWRLFHVRFADHSLDGVRRTALTVRDEAEQGVPAGLQVERHQLARAALEDRRDGLLVEVDRRLPLLGLHERLHVRDRAAFEEREGLQGMR